MNGLGQSPQWQSSAEIRQILALWPQFVGPAVAQHSQPTKIRANVLYVAVSSAAWSQTLTFERSRILQNIHQKLPTTQRSIRELRFAPAEWQRLSRVSEPTPTQPLSHHPCWADSPASFPISKVRNPDVMFQQWARRKQQQLANQSRCPACQSPCPTRELNRWSVCSICVAKRWHKLQGQNRQAAMQPKRN